MSARLLEWEELSDSRELLEARTPRVITWTIGLILIILCAGVVWCIFGKMDVVVKASGVVRSNDSAVKVVSQAAGSVEKIYFQPGQRVKKDQVLYEMNQEQWMADDKRLAEQLQTTRDELKQLTRFEEQLRTGDLNEQSVYLQIEDLLGGTDLEVDKLKLALINVRNNRERSDRLVAQLDKLQESIATGVNKLSTDDEQYYRFENYRQKKQQLELQLTALMDTMKRALREGDSEQIEEARRNLDNANLSADSLKADLQFAVVSELLSARQAQTEYQDKESGLMIQLADSISTAKKEIKELEYNQSVLRQEFDHRVVKAPVAGKVSVITDIVPGEFVQAGTPILTVIPEDGSEMIMQIAVANQDIARVKEGGLVKYRINAMPSSEFGTLSGSIERINPDATADSATGLSYYLIQGSIDSNVLSNGQGETSEVKIGMTAEASIVTDRKSIGVWLLEKLDLIA